MKNITPLISVIVPNYNHEKYLIQRLESIFNQTYSHFEVILLDDKSTDNSKLILSRYFKNNRVSHCMFNETNSGSTFKQWQKGINLAKGDYIWIAESDDYCETNFLERLIKPFIENKDVALSYCQSHRANSNGVITGNWITHTSMLQTNPLQQDFIMDGNVFIENYLIHKNVIPNVSAVLFNKAYLQKIIPLIFKPFMKYNADWFYYIQLICNAKVAFVSDSLNYFRYHENSVIAKADGESGRIKILNMEYKIRVFMFKYLKSCNPENILAIKEQHKISNDKLLYEKSSIYLEKANYLKAVISAFHSALILRKIVITIYMKMRNKFIKKN